MQCVNCKSTKNLMFVKAFSCVATMNEEMTDDDWKKHGWSDRWEAIKEFSRLEMVKLLQKDIDEGLKAGEEMYCGDCANKLKWGVVK